jgi:hypothetical protein
MGRFSCLGKTMAFAMFFLISTSLFAQVKVVSGTIASNEDGAPLLGVTVTNKTTGKKTKKDNGMIGYPYALSTVLVDGKEIQAMYGNLAGQVTMEDGSSVQVRLEGEKRWRKVQRSGNTTWVNVDKIKVYIDL